MAYENKQLLKVIQVYSNLSHNYENIGLCLVLINFKPPRKIQNIQLQSVSDSAANQKAYVLF